MDAGEGASDRSASGHVLDLWRWLHVWLERRADLDPALERSQQREVEVEEGGDCPRDKLRAVERHIAKALLGVAGRVDSIVLNAAALRGTGPLVATRALAARSVPPGTLAAVLLAAALALLLLEPLLRRPKATA